MSLAPYTDYRDSGIDWLGLVPRDWRVVPLKHLASIRYGIGEPPTYREEGVPLVRATNIDHGKILPEGLVKVDPEDIPANRAVWLSEGDIIVVRSGAYTGDSGLIRKSHLPAIAGFDMVLRPSGCEPAFLQFALLSPYLKERQIDLEKTRAAQPHLNAEELGACLLLVPSRQEQKVIAAFLDSETAKIDTLVEEQRRLIELLKEKRQAVISHAVTKGLDPSAPMKDSGVEWLGVVPAHWEITQVGRVCSQISYGFTNPMPTATDGPYMLTANDVGHGTVEYETARRTTLEAFESLLTDKSRPHDGDVLVTKDGTLGRVAIHDGRAACINQSVAFLRPDRAKVSPAFMAAALMDGVYQERMIFEAGGTTIKHIYISRLAKMAMAIPSLDEMQLIVKFCARESFKFTSLITEAEVAMTLLQERRSALISAAITGKIDVRGLAPAQTRAA